MTVAEWLGQRTPAPPAPLATRLQQLAPEAPAGVLIPEALLMLSALVLRRLLDEGETARDSALELLAADALATYAFEAQGESPDELEARCTWAMGYLSQAVERA